MCQEFRRAWFLVLLAVWALPAQARDDSRLTFRRIVSERVDPAMPVNAVPGVGLALAASTEAKLDPAKLWVLVPAEFVGDVTVSITTVDGRYLGTLLFAAAAGPRRWESISLATQSDERDAILGEYKRNHIAYAVSIKPAGAAAGTDAWLLVASDDPGSGSDGVSAVLLQSVGAESVFYRLPGRKRQMCARIRDRRTRFFDTACEIALADLMQLADSPAGQLRIERVSGTEPLDPVVVALR
jgi:hypothetical protein